MKTERNQDRVREIVQEAFARHITAESALAATGTEDKPAAKLLDRIQEYLADVTYEVMFTGFCTPSQTAETAESRSTSNMIEDDLADDIASIVERLERGIAAEREAMDKL